MLSYVLPEHPRSQPERLIGYYGWPLIDLWVDSRHEV
jgi:hypothetical protein